MSKSNKENIKVLKKLANGNKLHLSSRDPDNGCIKNTIIRLKRQALIVEDNSGDFKITPEGKAFLKRAMCSSDGSYAAQHRDMREVGVEEKLRINLSESPLARLYYRRGRNGQKLIQEHQFQAGERLRQDFEAAHLSPKLGLTLAPKVDGGRGGSDASYQLDSAMAARARLDQALRFVGNEMNSLLLDVCCFLKGLECIERERQWPVRSAKIVLSLALERLADHYGLSKTAVGAGSSIQRKPREWHADNQ